MTRANLLRNDWAIDSNCYPVLGKSWQGALLANSRVALQPLAVHANLIELLIRELIETAGHLVSCPTSFSLA